MYGLCFRIDKKNINRQTSRADISIKMISTTTRNRIFGTLLMDNGKIPGFQQNILAAGINYPNVPLLSDLVDQ